MIHPSTLEDPHWHLLDKWNKKCVYAQSKLGEKLWGSLGLFAQVCLVLASVWSLAVVYLCFLTDHPPKGKHYGLTHESGAGLQHHTWKGMSNIDERQIRCQVSSEQELSASPQASLGVWEIWTGESFKFGWFCLTVIWAWNRSVPCFLV